MSAQPIVCVSCDREIPAADVNINTGLAKCTACNAVFGIMDQVAGGVAGSRSPRGEVPMPKKITVEDLGGELRIVYRWFTPAAYFLIFFCLFWDGFLVFWYFIAFHQNAPLMMKVFPIIHVAVGVGLTYFVVALFVNKTTITTGEGLLSVRHGPLAWPGSRTLNSDEIDQVYCIEKLRTNNDRVTRTFDVYLKMTDDDREKLVSGLEDIQQALFIEQEIERFLRIDDTPVAGEVPR